MSLLREVKPRNARTARIVKAREPQLLENRKRVLLLHGNKCPIAVSTVLRTISSLTKPDSVLLTKKNGDIHPFEDASSIEFLAGKNDCGIVVFGTHSKKRPNNITVSRIFDNKILDMVELLLLNGPEEFERTNEKQQHQQQQQHAGLSVGIEMKPLILFAGSQWDDDSTSDSANLYRTLKSTLLDLFQGEEINSIDVAGLQFVLMIAAGEQSSTTVLPATTAMNGGTSAPGSATEDPANKPVLHLRWYKIRTVRSQTPKIPRVELDPVGPSFDFRVGRYRIAEQEAWREAMKHGRRPNEARTKKNVETDLMGDKLGRVHLGKQDLSQLQTRKMKGLKRSRDDDGEGDVQMNGNGNGNSHGLPDGLEDDDDDDDDDDDELEGGMEVDLIDEDGDEIDDGEGSSVGGTGDEIDIGDSDDDDMNAAEMPKRQKLR